MEHNSDPLDKSLKEKLASLATAAAIVGAPYNQAKAPVDVPQIPKVSVTQEQGLRPIAYIESRNGANMRHEKVHHGLNSGTSAIGIYGFMPLQVQDTIKHDDVLKHKYGNLLQYHPIRQSHEIENFLMKHPEAQHELANSHWHRVNSIFHKNKDRAIYAWKYGIHGAAEASGETIQSDPYVKDYHKYKKMLDVEKPYKGNEPLRPIKKSEKSQVNPKHLKFTYEKMDPKEDMFGNKHTVHEFRVHLKGHGEVGQATVHKYKDGHAHVDYVHVDEDHRGKGIANHLYNHIEQRLKTDLEPSEDQTEQGERLWDKRLNRSEFDLAETLEKALMLNPHVQDIAEGYARSKGAQLNHDLSPVKINPEHGYMIASAYERMPHNPADPEVKSAYNSLVNETKDQYKHLLSSGYKFSPIQPGQDNPYKSSKDMLADVHNNKHLWYYPTEQGFGGEEQHKDHPLLQPTEFTDKHGKPMLANDVFRQVHDIFGHAMYGNGFGPSGEHKAYLAHKQMYTPEAGKALASETMGQNNWVNWNGKFGEQNRRTPQKTVYAEQKAGLLPEHVLNESWHSDVKKSEYTRVTLSKSGDTLVHYSQNPEIVSVIDPRHHGAGVPGAERKRPGRIPRSYYYDTEEGHEPVVTGSAKYRYTVQHPGKILDLASDESKHVRDAAKNDYGVIEPDKLEQVIHDRGYNGYKNSAGSSPNVVAVFKPLEVKDVHPFVNLHHTDILTHGRSMNEAFNDVKNGKKTMSKGPLQVHRTEDGRYKLIDGHHRFAEGLLNGQERYPAEVVSSGYSDYHAIPAKDEEFKFQKSKQEYFEHLEKGARGDWKKDGGYTFDVNHLNYTGTYDPRKKYRSTTVRVYHKGKHFSNQELYDIKDNSKGRYRSISEVDKVFNHPEHGGLVGSSTFESTPGDPHEGEVGHVHVEEDHRRKGLATAMYQKFEEATGMKARPAQAQYEDAKALWAQPNRPFGKAEQEYFEHLEKAIDPKKGEDDIGKKSLNEIQKDTAEVWASRSIAAYKRFEKTKDPRWKIDAEEYRHEAVEHAALVVDVYPSLIREISKAIEKYRGKTTEELDDVCKAEYPRWVDNRGLIDYLTVTSDIDEAAASTLAAGRVAYRRMLKISNITSKLNLDLRKVEHYLSLPSEIRPPIVVDEEGTLVDGCQRLHAAIEKGEREIDAYVMVAPDILKKAKGTGRTFDEMTHDALADLQNFRNSPQQYGSVFATGEEPRSTTYGAKPATLYSFGPHWPIARILDNRTIAVNTHPYGGQTQQLVDKVMKELPEYFPAHNVVEVNHPDYLKSAQIMRGGEQAIREHLEDASKNHPDPEARAKASEYLKLMGGLQKGTKEKRDAFIGYDPKYNEDVRVSRLKRYLTSVGLQASPHLDEEADSKRMGRDTPTSLTTSPNEGPVEQQLTHEASHAQQTPPGMTLRDYQEAIGKPGTRVHDVTTLGPLPPEVRAQMGEAGVSRRAGLSPFRARPGWKDPGTKREVAYDKAKEAQQMLDEGIVRFEPLEGRLEYQSTPNALINIRAKGDKALADEIRRRKFGKSDDLDKGVKQRLFPFDPVEVPEEHKEKLSQWTDPLDSDPNPVGRESIPMLQGNARKRALHSLSGKTQVRWNKENNEREFLLHRGMSGYEHEDVVKDGKYKHSHRTSWTPKHNVATSFAESYEDPTKQTKVVSAWVPESKIHHIPMQVGALSAYSPYAEYTNKQVRSIGPNEWRNEQEIIVEPGEYDVDDQAGQGTDVVKGENIDLEILFKAEFNPAEGVTDFIPLYVSDNNEKEASYIDQMIKSGKTYNLPHKGLFTRESFIAGANPDHAWLIKVEPNNRPGIKAVQNTGPQPVKEATFYEASKLFGLSQFIPQTILGHIRKNGEERWAVAIKMLPKSWQPMAQVNDENHGASKGIMRKYIVTGMSHMLAFMLYVLGDLDSHGNNYLTDGTHIMLIDHGSSFADMRSEDKSDKKMHVPYVLRSEGFKKKMDPDQKLSFMPKVATVDALNRLKQYIMAVDPQKLEQVISSYKLDPRPEVARLKIVQHLVGESEHPDIILNHLWIKGSPRELIEQYYEKVQ